jgi:hypothetical protein
LITPGTPVVGTLNPAVASNAYQFSANAGDQFFFDSQGISGTGDTYWRLINPFGQVVFGATIFNDVSTLTLPASGTYVLVIEPRVFDTVNRTYTFNVQFIANVPPQPFTGTSLSLGTLTTGSINSASQQDSYVFTLTDESTLHFDALTNKSSLRWTLKGPKGTEVSNRTFTSSDSADGDPILRLLSGSYQLTIDGSNTATSLICTGLQPPLEISSSSICRH